VIRAEVRGSLRELLARDYAAAEREVSTAVNAAGLRVQGQLRVVTRAAFRSGGGIANAWRLRSFPQGQPSLGAAAQVWTRAPRIIDAFSRNTVILPQAGGSLAVPTDVVRARFGNRRVSPKEFTRRTGIALRAVYRRGKPSLLVADNVRIGARGRVRLNETTRGGRRATRVAGRTTVVVYILLQGLRLRQRFDLDAIASQAMADLDTRLNAALRRALG
jgi:hypothetical protein